MFVTKKTIDVCRYDKHTLVAGMNLNDRPFFMFTFRSAYQKTDISVTSLTTQDKYDHQNLLWH